MRPGNGTIELTFLGTRGEIEFRSRRHRRHSALLVQYSDVRVMIDCGADWLHRVRAIAPTAIVLTHAHRDHAAGLAGGASSPVYATETTLKVLNLYQIADLRRMPLRKFVTIGGLKFKAVPVQHCIRAPAVGYRVCAGGTCFFYLPDVAELPNPAEVLRGIDVYIGDGATMRRSMVRKKGGTLIGHGPMTAQLGWCEEAGVRHVVFTHCGSAVVRGETRRLKAVVKRLGYEHGVDARLACDGDRLSLATAGGGARRHGTPKRPQGRCCKSK